MLFFILGLLIGSFLNVLIDRLPRGESMLGRSHCESCKKTLSWKDLIPLISFLYLRGRCRYCRVRLSYQYPLLEILTGLVFVFTIYYLPPLHASFAEVATKAEQGFAGQAIINLATNYLISSIYYLTIVSSLIVIFFADLKYGIIPDKIIFPSIVVSLIYLAISTFYPLSSNIPSSIFNHLLSAIVAFLFFLFIYLITKGRGMGFGDVKLAFLIGLVLGFPGTVLALYIAFLTGGFIGIILILWKKKKLKYAIPFGPFLVIGCGVGLFFQDQIVQKLLGFF